MFNNYSGINTNHSEGLNNLLKELNERKQLPIDRVLLSFYQLSIFYLNEIKYGMGNKGEYKLNLNETFHNETAAAWFCQKCISTSNHMYINKC